MEDGIPDPTAVRAAPDSTHSPFTATTRIKELHDIDTSIAQLLKAAGEALQVLVFDSGSDASSGPMSTATLPSAKSQFLNSVTTYFQTLSSIDVRLRRQIYALEEAGLIGKGDAKDARKGASGAGTISGSAGGQLDLGWLTGGGDQVEKDMEREMWRIARVFIDKLGSEVDRNTPTLKETQGSMMNQDADT